MLMCIYVFTAAFAVSWGPVCWLYPVEAIPTEQRAKGVALTTASNFLFCIAITQFSPVLLVAIHFKFFLIFAGLAAAMGVFVYVWVPETSRKGLEEIASETK